VTNYLIGTHLEIKFFKILIGTARSTYALHKGRNVYRQRTATTELIANYATDACPKLPAFALKSKNSS
jgi:hypothetical protein